MADPGAGKIVAPRHGVAELAGEDTGAWSSHRNATSIVPTDRSTR
jgi:hypothetical protein